MRHIVLVGMDSLWKPWSWAGMEQRAASSKIVCKMCSTSLARNRAFAALLKNGRVLAWGDPKYGGDTRFVRDELQDCTCHNDCLICASINSGL